MEQFKYISNHPCHLTLKVEGEYQDFSLFKGETYALPEENSVVQRMKTQGLLESVDISSTTSKNKKSNGS